MLIKNNEDRLHNVAGLMTLAPGVNEVPDDIWKKASQQSGVKRLLKERILEPLRSAGDATTTAAGEGTGAPGGAVSAATDIAGLEPQDAIRVVGETVDRALLTRWATEAKDRNVKAAVEQQLAAIGLTEEERQSALKKKGGK